MKQKSPQFRNSRVNVHGWVVFDKPYGMTSTKAVAVIKSLFNAKKAGHAGTLDPLATGLLPIALGEATKTVPMVQDGEKTYRFEVCWGAQTTTDDREGDTLFTSDHRPKKTDIDSVLDRFIGEIEQLPPKFSALKIDGERAYDLARDGREVNLKPRIIDVHNLRLIDMPNQDHTIFEAVCGKGTYVRALCRDIAIALGTRAHVSELRRTAVGPFVEAAMVTLEALETGKQEEQLGPLLVPLVMGLSHLPEIALESADTQKVRVGNPVLVRGNAAPLACDECFASHKGKPVAIGRISKGQFHPKRVFNL